jgi:hypothetical protein
MRRPLISILLGTLGISVCDLGHRILSCSGILKKGPLRQPAGL